MNQLILHPRDMFASYEPEILHQALVDLAFLADTFTFDGKPHYRPGEDFLELMTFLGCSPVISLGEPGLTGEDFCHISTLPEHPEPIFVHGNNIKPPRCPHCRETRQDWQTLIQEWEQDKQGYRHHCPSCGQECAINELKWRQSAGFLRSGIVVWGIYEGEAVPSDRLLACLQQHTQTPWTYFYYRNES